MASSAYVNGARFALAGGTAAAILMATLATLAYTAQLPLNRQMGLGLAGIELAGGRETMA